MNETDKNVAVGREITGRITEKCKVVLKAKGKPDFDSRGERVFLKLLPSIIRSYHESSLFNSI